MKFYDNKYNQYFLLFIISHLAIWVLLPTLLRGNINLDAMEGLAWGHEWQLGYHKHPPMAAWISQAGVSIFGKYPIIIYFLSQISICLAFIGVWKLAKNFLSTKEAFLATILLECVYYYNFTSPEFNPNVLMLPLWAWAIYFAWKIYDKNQLIDWVFFAIIAAIGMFSKYTFAIIILAFLILLIYSKKIFDLLKSPYPYIAALLFFGLFSPHLYWLVKSDFIPFKYVATRLQSTPTLLNHITIPLSFILAQLFSLSFLIIAFLFLSKRKPMKLSEIKNDKKALFLLFMGILPLFIMVLPSIISGGKMKDMWGMQLWNIFAICLFYFFRPALDTKYLLRFYKAWAVIISLPIIIYSGYMLIDPDRYADFNGKYLARTLTDLWHKNNNSKLEIVAGDVWVAGNIGFFSDDSPKTFIDMDASSSPWLSYEIFAKKGGIIVWDVKEEGYALPDRFKNKINAQIIEQKPITLLQNRNNGRIFTIGWAMILPKKSS